MAENAEALQQAYITKASWMLRANQKLDQFKIGDR